jgi:hypothetical protein
MLDGPCHHFLRGTTGGLLVSDRDGAGISSVDGERKTFSKSSTIRPSGQMQASGIWDSLQGPQFLYY